MRKICSILLLGIFILSGQTVSAQAKLTTGDIRILNSEKVLNLQFDYSGMTVGKYKDENKYIEDGIAERNKKKAGTGDEWGKKWVSDRKDRFQPRFEENLNKTIGKTGVTAREGASDAKYTLICRTTFTEPGFNVGVMRQNAWIKMVVDVVETSNPGTVIASIEMKKEESVNMMGYDFDTGARIESCYDRAGDDLGKLLNKTAYK